MYAAMRRYNVNEGTVGQIVERVNADFLPRLRQAPGFVSYFLLDAGDGTIASVSVFDDKRGAEESSRMASEWVRQNISHLVKSAPVILSGEIKVHSMETAAH